MYLFICYTFNYIACSQLFMGFFLETIDALTTVLVLFQTTGVSVACHIAGVLSYNSERHRLLITYPYMLVVRETLQQSI